MVDVYREPCGWVLVVGSEINPCPYMHHRTVGGLGRLFMHCFIVVVAQVFCVGYLGLAKWVSVGG